MKQAFIFIVLLASAVTASAQKKYQISADSVRIFSDCGIAELIIENKTRNVEGYLFNKDLGRTEFRRLELVSVGDSAIAIPGQDTVLLRSVWWMSKMSRGLEVAKDEDYEVPTNTRIVILPDITAARQLKLPPPENNLNREITIIDKTTGPHRWKISGAFVNRGTNGAPPYTAEDGVQIGQGDKLILNSDGQKWYNSQVCCGN